MKTRIAFGSVLLAAVVMTLVMSGSALVEHLGAVPRALSGAAAVFLLLGAVALQVSGHLMRSVKHRLLLQGIRPISFRQVFRGQMIGFVFNALLPFRVGEIMRAHYIGRAVQISRAAVFATIVFERAVDLGVVVIIGLFALVAVGFPPAAAFVLLVLISLLGAGVLIGALAVTTAQPHWFLVLVHRTTGTLNQSLCDRGRHIVWSFSHSLKYALPDRRLLVRYLLLSAVMWCAYLGSITLVVLAVFGPGISLRNAAALLDAPYLGVSTWMGPAYLGEYLARAEGVLAPWTAGATSTIFVLLTWCLLVVPSVIIGSACLLHRRLVEHIDGDPTTLVVRSKLFREVDTSEGFAQILAAHFQGSDLSRIVSREESAGRFTVLRALKGGSNATTLLVVQGGEVVVKKVTLPAFRSKLESQFDWLQSRGAHPEIVDVVGRWDGRDHFDIDIEYREGYVSFFEFLHATTPETAWSVLENVIRFMDTAVYRPVQVEDRQRLLEQYLSTKVIDKVLDTAEASIPVKQLLEHSHLEINGRRFLNLGEAVERIRRTPAALDDLLDFSQEAVHGDLTIDNLMVHPGTREFMIIDPNDENLISDRVVDFGKILQSLHSGYEFLVEQDEVQVSGSSVSFEERRSAHYEYLYARCRQEFAESLTPARWRALLFHEAVHYCRMLTYRAAIDERTVAMYYAIATRLFNDFLAQYQDVDHSRGGRALAASSR